jgi:hypothetical protein
MPKHLRGKGKLGRRVAFKELKPVVLIVCEGRETEPNYFNDLKRVWDLTTVDVEVVGSNVCGTTAPKGIVDYAKCRFQELRKERRDVKKEDVWCVFDRDQHPSFDEAIKKAKDNGFGAAFSNPSFELWYLLHFQSQTAHIERDDVTKLLKTHIPGYEKYMTGLFRSFLSKLPGAEEHAANLRIKHEGDGNPPMHNPSTGVDRLVGHLRKIS